LAIAPLILLKITAKNPHRLLTNAERPEHLAASCRPIFAKKKPSSVERSTEDGPESEGQRNSYENQS
jgi:hypothetical protein